MPQDNLPTDIELDQLKAAPSTDSQLQFQTTGFMQESHSGPLPPARSLAQYNDVVEGAAERILVMAESSLSHSNAIEITALKGAISTDRIGQVCGLLVTLAALTVSGFTAYIGEALVASIIGGSTIVSLAVVFVIGKKPTKN